MLADMLKNTQKPVIGFAAYSGTGKTTLLKEIIPLLRGKGIRVGVIKHAHHSFDIDTPGKDSYELRKAGADQVLIASSTRRALIKENVSGKEPKLEDMIKELDLGDVDLVLVEGFRHLPFPKIELHRPCLNRKLIFPEDSNVIAVATDSPIDTDGIPVLDINKPVNLVMFIQQWLA